MAIIDQIKALTRQLLPTGKAFWIPVGGPFEKLLNGLHASEARAYADAVSILNSILPDNSNFTTDDATQWERRLGLITNTAVSLMDRKLAIQRKMEHPGTIKARQNYRYMEAQLRAAGFDVYVYENRFPTYFGYVTKTPAEFFTLPFPIRSRQHGTFQHGQTQHGGGFGNKVVNYINQSLDYPFNLGGTYRFTFFIGGPTPGSFAILQESREVEFRQLVLKLKGVNKIAFLGIVFY